MLPFWYITLIHLPGSGVQTEVEVLEIKIKCPPYTADMNYNLKFISLKNVILIIIKMSTKLTTLLWGEPLKSWIEMADWFYMALG